MSISHPSESLPSKCQGHTDLSESILLSIISLKAQDELSVLHWGFAVVSVNGKIVHYSSTSVEDQPMNMKQAFGFRARSEVIMNVLTARVVRHEPSWP